LPVGIPEALDPVALAKQQGKPCDCAGVIDAAATLLFGAETEAAWRDGIARACQADRKAGDLRRAVALVLASPEAVLG
jgi:hypothetical protein